MKVRFYNAYGYGDLFDSRNFVLEWMRLLGVKHAEYAHARDHIIFADMPQLVHYPLAVWMHPQAAYERIGGVLHINTWIGRGWNSDAQSGGYVMNPGVGCCVENIWHMHFDTMTAVSRKMAKHMNQNLVDYLPSIDHTRLRFNAGVSQWLIQNAGKRINIMCNGPTTSMQASNIDYAELMRWIPRQDDTVWVFTQDTPGVQAIAKRGDIALAHHITGGGCDLNSISYISRFATLIVGRCSGPHMFCQVRENWQDPHKTLVCFTHHRNGACFVRWPEKLGLKMRVAWSPLVDPKAMAQYLNECIQRTERIPIGQAG